ncbi:hypothetical protein [Nocardiopsis lucentensis]|uniref:hypothetical protein n=1 Tax=Nocardiopsis lucentensis TaxID=53441 RepID=UPI001268D5E7|nr:hypothetical protein [Nocardiopsis lucentensis]
MSDTDTSPTTESAPGRPSRVLRVFAVVHLGLMLLGLPCLGLLSLLHLLLPYSGQTASDYLGVIGVIVGLWALGSCVGWWLMRALEVDGAPRYALSALFVGTAVIVAPHVVSVVGGIAG